MSAAEKDQAFIEGDFFTKITGSDTSGVYTLTPNPSSSRIEFENSAFTAASSPFIGSYNTESSTVIPRPCAFYSLDMGAVEYYRGQNTLTYDIATLEGEPTFTLENGGAPDSIAHYSQEDGVLHI